MLITMLADRFDAGGVLRARGTQVDVSNDLALRWIGDGVATAVGNAREAAQGMRREVEVMQDLVSGQQLAAGAPVSGAWNTYRRDALAADPGTLLTSWAGATIVANGTPSSGPAGLVGTDLAPVRADRAVRLIGDAAIRASVTSVFTAIQSDARSFRSLAVWVKVKGRSQSHAAVQLFLGNGTDPYAGKAMAMTFAAPSDGKWHLVVVSPGSMQALNAFVLGTDTIQSIGIRDRHVADGSLGVTGMLTNAEELQIGPVYLNPWSRPKFLIRMDDSLAEFARGGVTFTADGITRQWSHLDLLTQFGFRGKGSIFHLTRRIGTTTNREFLTRADLDMLAGLGWSHCAQSHQDPVSADNRGVRLMGPEGFAARAVASVDASANTITASAAHNIANGYWGYPVVFTGTDLPSPLLAGQVYWARQTTTTAFTLHLNEVDAVLNTNAIDLTTTGVPANFTFRYGFSANDFSLVQQDIATCIGTLQSWGFGKTASIWAPNQGAIDVDTQAAARAAGVSLTCLIGNTGAAFDRPISRHPHAIASGIAGGVGSAQIMYPGRLIPSAVQTDGAVTDAQIRAYVDAVIACGGIGSNYHHGLAAGANSNQLVAYLDQLRLRVSEGACDVVTAEEMQDYLTAGRESCVGVSL